MNKDFVIANADTDSISFRKSDGSFISKQEREYLLNEINSLFPEKINFSDDGYFSHFIVLAAKNYIMKDEKGKVKLKGSSIKSSSIEPVLKQMNSEIIDCLLSDEKDKDFLHIYKKYVKMVDKITDIKLWASKKTISAKTLTNTRKQEANIRKAIEGTDYVEGDKIYVYFNSNDELVLVENFNGDYNRTRLYERLYACLDKFAVIIDNNQFLNYNLKRNQEALGELLK